MTDSAPAGWYDDGQTPGQERYWDGTQWTEQFRPVAPAVPTPAPPAPPTAPAGTPGPAYVPVAAPARKPVSIWAWLAPLLVVIVAGIAVGVWFLVQALTGAISGPQDTVKRWATAMAQQDCEAVYATTTPNARAIIELPGTDAASCQDAIGEPDRSRTGNVAISSTEVVNATATVEALVTNQEGETRAMTISLLNQGGTWLIDDLVVEGEPTPEPDPVDPPEDPQADAEAAVLATVQEYNEAWNAYDCDRVLAVVTQAYVDTDDGATCDIIAGDEAAGVTYTVDLVDVQVGDDTATVVTREQWTDAEGESFDEQIEYGLVRDGDDWLIDSYGAQDGEFTPLG